MGKRMGMPRMNATRKRRRLFAGRCRVGSKQRVEAKYVIKNSLSVVDVVAVQLSS
jgi:hypothetical protein